VRAAVQEEYVNDAERKCETVSIGEAAELAGLSPQTIRNYIDKGIIPADRNPYNNYREIWSTDAARLRRR